jgi:hypothetical protein
MINLCQGCHGRGQVGWPWWARPCPECPGQTEAFGGLHPHPIPPPPPPPKRLPTVVLVVEAPAPPPKCMH